jgi:hypothetical protein
LIIIEKIVIKIKKNHKPDIKIHLYRFEKNNWQLREPPKKAKKLQRVKNLGHLLQNNTLTT